METKSLHPRTQSLVLTASVIDVGWRDIRLMTGRKSLECTMVLHLAKHMHIGYACQKIEFCEKKLVFNLKD